MRSDPRNEIFDQQLWHWQSPVNSHHPDYDPPKGTTRIVIIDNVKCFFARTGVKIVEMGDDDYPDASRNPTTSPDAEGNQLWNEVELKKYILQNSFEDPVSKGGREFSKFRIYEPGDSLRFKIMKCLSTCIQQITADSQFEGMITRRGFDESPDTSARRNFHEVIIKERQFLNLSFNRFERDRTPGRIIDNSFFDIIINGWPPRDLSADDLFPTDSAYPLMEAIRSRLNSCRFDENGDRNIFRLAKQNNSVLKIQGYDATVNMDQANNPGCFLFISFEIVEDLADSTYGDR